MSTGFSDLGLRAEVLSAVEKVGYEAPTPIQSAAIPPLLAGQDVLGQAQTGTGKTAAFALPLLSRLDLAQQRPQILVMTPTRELALQVAEALQTYARGLKGFHVLPVYGGQSIDVQLRHLRSGVHAVVGTPGRILDHLRRGTLDLAVLRAVVLDEADEMLRMGFIDDVEEILRHTPKEKQVALFSATLPPAIARIAKEHLRDPVDVKIESKTVTVAAVTQRYWKVVGANKLDALTRILEVEDFDAMLVFVRTKVATVELSEKLEARGFACSALNGDMSQALRERAIQRLKNQQLDIVVATDVAARGLDVDRISHVINFDVPYDTEAYIHRIGRTGRAGRPGNAILFVMPRERSLLHAIERATRQFIEPMDLPTHADVAERRAGQFKETIAEALEGQDLTFFRGIVESFCQEHEASLEDVAAALAFLAQRERPLQSTRRAEERPAPSYERPSFGDSRQTSSRQTGPQHGSSARPPEEGMATYRVDVGREHNVQPKNIVGAIANEAKLDSRRIGKIQIQDTFSFVDLPEGMPPEILDHLKSVMVFGRPLNIHMAAKAPPGSPRSDRRPVTDTRKKTFRPGPGNFKSKTTDPARDGSPNQDPSGQDRVGQSPRKRPKAAGKKKGKPEKAPGKGPGKKPTKRPAKKKLSKKKPWEKMPGKKPGDTKPTA